MDARSWDSSPKLTQPRPVAISPSDGNSLSQGRRPVCRASRSFPLMAMSTVIAPITMVGSGSPARAIALTGNRQYRMLPTRPRLASSGQSARFNCASVRRSIQASGSAIRPSAR